MICGIGTDLVEVARLVESLERTPTLRQRLFTHSEANLPVESLAARFAAKEALAKALGAPSGLSWQHVQVVDDEAGRPGFELSGTVAQAVSAYGASRAHLSLSHDGGFALAFVVLEGGGGFPS